MTIEIWAIVELMGHVRVAGKLTEEEHFGAKLGRIDVPKLPDKNCVNCKGLDVAPCPTCGGGGFVTQFFGGSSVYRITAVSEDVARAAAKSTQIQPVHSWEMPQHQLASVREDDDETSGDDDDDRF